MKNILKKILNNKKTKKVVKKKVKTVKKVVKTKKKEVIKNENLRIPKTSELKPEIKKIKKQETEKKDFKAN